MSQRTILCYGDSNTWGYVPTHDFTAPQKRYSRSERWPGVLQQLLGSDFHVVEEGLNSRTTNLDYQFPPDRNGKTYLSPCLYSHAPIDLVVLALGGNDFKTYFNRNATDIKVGLAELVDIIQNSKYGNSMSAAPEILILTTPIPLQVAEQSKDEMGVAMFEGVIKKAQLLATSYLELSKEKNCHFLDLSKDVFPSEIDGVHFDHIAHGKLARMVSNKIKCIFYK